MQRKFYDKGTKPLVSLQPGETVRMYDIKLLKWREQAAVKEMIADRSYIVETKDKARYRRNRNRTPAKNKKRR